MILAAAVGSNPRLLRPITRLVAKKRLLIAITLAETGGAQSYVAELLPALAERYDVVVAAHGPGPLEDAARRAGARFVPLRHVRRRIGLRDLIGLAELVYVPYEQVYGLGIDDMLHRVPAIDKIKAAIGWAPERSLDEILADVIAYTKADFAPV